MKTTDPVDAARVELLLADLRLGAIKLMWTKLAAQSDKEGLARSAFPGGARRARDGRSRAAAASSVTSPKHGCRSAKPSRASTSRRCRWSARPRRWGRCGRLARAPLLRFCDQRRR
jgi:hypothetical protein